MGGGGGSFDMVSPSEYNKMKEELKEKTKDEQFETQVAELIATLLADYNDRDHQAIKAHLEKINEYLENVFGGTIDIIFGGSIKKHTYIDGLSDIDVLVLINKCDLSDLSPKGVLRKIQSRLLDRKFKDVIDVNVGNLAVTITFSDNLVIQLLPAIQSGIGYRISTKDGSKWSNIINPDKFAKRLTKINQSCGGKVVPVIKLIKGINDHLPKPQQLDGYHIESMAIEIFKSYPESNSKTSKAMLKYFFEKAKEVIRKPIKDSTNQSINVDEDLGPENSKSRIKISNTFDIIFRRIRDADEVGDIEKWKEILGAN